MNDGRYTPIPPAAVIPGALPEFRIYVRTPQGRYVLWALEGNKVTAEQLARLSDGGYLEITVPCNPRSSAMIGRPGPWARPFDRSLDFTR